jgi:hypothetical protein
MPGHAGTAITAILDLTDDAGTHGYFNATCGTENYHPAMQA